MLILLPPSETKTAPRRGKAVDLDALTFPTLTPTRVAVLDALVATSAERDACRRLGVSANLEDVVRRNVDLRDAPATSAERVYSGVLYDALDVEGLETAARRRARAWIVVVSALWGAVRLGDRIPAYRLNMCGRLEGVEHLTRLWQPALADVLPNAAGRGLVVDCRSSDYLAAWRPAGSLVDRTVVVKVFNERDGKRTAASHNAKHIRGLIARRIVIDAIDPRRPDRLADALAAHFDVDLVRSRPSQPWELHVFG